MESYQLKENATESLIEKGTYELTRELEMIETYSLAKSKYLTGTICLKMSLQKFIRKLSETKTSYVVRCTIWYHLYNLKNVKNTHGGVLILAKLHECFSRF